MRPKRPCYVYKDHTLIGKFPSLKDASYATGDNTNSILMVLNNVRPMTRKGFVYVDEPLTEEEMEHMPIKEEKKPTPRHNNNCKVILSNQQEFDVDCNEHNVFYLERSREGRKAQLRQFIYTKLKYYWMTTPMKVSMMEKRFVDELLESL